MISDLYNTWKKMCADLTELSSSSLFVFDIMEKIMYNVWLFKVSIIKKQKMTA